MGFFGFLKDTAMLPIDAAMDITGISMITNMDDDPEDNITPFSLERRIRSMKKNLDETYD